MEMFKRKSIFHGRITFYQDFRTFGFSIVLDGENRLFDRGTFIDIKVLFWLVEIYLFKEK